MISASLLTFAPPQTVFSQTDVAHSFRRQRELRHKYGSPSGGPGNDSHSDEYASDNSRATSASRAQRTAAHKTARRSRSRSRSVDHDRRRKRSRDRSNDRGRRSRDNSRGRRRSTSKSRRRRSRSRSRSLDRRRHADRSRLVDY